MVTKYQIEINLNSKNATYYEKKGYLIPRYFDNSHNKWKFKRNSILKVWSTDLPPQSRQKVICECGVCGKPRILKMQCSHKICPDCANSSIKRKQKISKKLKNRPKTKQHKDNIRKSLTKSGHWKTTEQRSQFQNYKLKVLYETKKHIKELFKNWNGLDYYTGEKLLTEISKCQHKMYRTIDHKISTKHGFENHISPQKIGKIQNLCICSRSNNSKKKNKPPEDFLVACRHDYTNS